MTPRVLVGIPSLQTVDINFAMRLVGLVSTTVREGVACVAQPAINFALPNAHNMLVEDARRFGCSHLMLVETDNTFPHDALLRLLARDKPIVGATYLMRSPPHWAMGRELDITRPIDVTGGGCREVSRLPVGCILIRMDVLESMAAPIWECPWNGRTFETDDYRFCDKAREKGWSVHCDCDLSMEVGHMATIELKLTDNRAVAVDAMRKPLENTVD
jgi:hypothetical protein